MTSGVWHFSLALPPILIHPIFILYLLYITPQNCHKAVRLGVRGHLTAFIYIGNRTVWWTYCSRKQQSKYQSVTLLFFWKDNLPMASGFPLQRNSNAESVYTSWHHHVTVVTYTVYPKKYAHGFCFAVLCCGYTLTDFPISIRLTSLALWQSNDCPSASKATLMNMDKYFMWIHYERLHNHNKAKHNKTVCIFLGIYCMIVPR